MKGLSAHWRSEGSSQGLELPVVSCVKPYQEAEVSLVGKMIDFKVMSSGIFAFCQKFPKNLLGSTAGCAQSFGAG